MRQRQTVSKARPDLSHDTDTSLRGSILVLARVSWVIVVVLVALFLMDWRSALVVATAIPLTVAILVTVLATVGGLIPLNLTGGELWRPLTGVHIFGLLCATSLTLVVLPVLYYIFCAKLRWIK